MLKLLSAGLMLLSGGDALSRIPCSKLGWDASTYGAGNVCGASRIFEGECFEPVNFAEAQEACLVAGARLCSAAELAADEARDTGCGIDALATWAAQDTCPAGSARSLAGSSPFAYFFPSRCIAATDKLEVRCCADEFVQTPCASEDKCQAEANPANECIDLPGAEGSPATYQCSCRGAGWSTAPGAQACVPPSLCLQDECSTSLDAGNLCLDRRDGTYTCSCASPWELALTEGTTGPGCVGPWFVGAPAASGAQPSESKDMHAITITPRANGFVRCVALDAAPGLQITARQVMAAQGAFAAAPVAQAASPGLPLSFEFTELRPGTGYYALCATDKGGLSTMYAFSTAADVCDAEDPCATALDPANSCLSEGSAFQCTCGGEGWRLTPDSMSCVPALPCAPTNGCASQANDANTCTARADGSYFCTCTAGWALAPSLQACELVTCTLDECRTTQNAGNQCVDTGDGRHGCVCASGWRRVSLDSEGWVEAGLGEGGAETCLPPVTACSSDPCLSAAHAGNQCFVVVPDRVQCACDEAAGWSLADGGSSCRPPAAPTPAHPACGQDLCRQSASSANVCITLSDQEYRCECGGYGWTAGWSGMSCTEKAKPCETGDHCQAQLDARNICLNRNDETYVCRCFAPGWTVAPGGLSCVAPAMQCVSDECRTAADPSNLCVDLGDATYRCECGGTGWRTPDDGLSCRPPSSTCISDECSTSQSAANECVELLGGDAYTCRCQGRGWSQGPRDESCVPPIPLCLSGECSTQEHPANTCTDARDGTFTCACTPPFYPTGDRQGCVQRLPAACQSDECSSFVNPDNRCLTNDTVGGELSNTGVYTCACAVPFWMPSVDRRSCDEVVDRPRMTVNITSLQSLTTRRLIPLTFKFSEGVVLEARSVLAWIEGPHEPDALFASVLPVALTVTPDDDRATGVAAPDNTALKILDFNAASGNVYTASLSVGPELRRASRLRVAVLTNTTRDVFNRPLQEHAPLEVIFDPEPPRVAVSTNQTEDPRVAVNSSLHLNFTWSEETTGAADAIRIFHVERRREVAAGWTPSNESDEERSLFEFPCVPDNSTSPVFLLDDVNGTASVNASWSAVMPSFSDQGASLSVWLTASSMDAFSAGGTLLWWPGSQRVQGVVRRGLLQSKGAVEDTEDAAANATDRVAPVIDETTFTNETSDSPTAGPPAPLSTASPTGMPVRTPAPSTVSPVRTSAPATASPTSVPTFTVSEAGAVTLQVVLDNTTATLVLDCFGTTLRSAALPEVVLGLHNNPASPGLKRSAWNLVTAVVDLSLGGDGLRIYVNDELVASAAAAPGVMDMALRSSLLLGSGAATVSRRALSREQVSALYQRSTADTNMGAMLKDLPDPDTDSPFLDPFLAASPFTYSGAVVVSCDPLQGGDVLVDGLEACVFPPACAPTPAVTFAPTQAPTGRPMVWRSYTTELAPVIFESVPSLQWGTIIPAPVRAEDSILVLVEGGFVRDVAGNMQSANTSIELTAYEYRAPPFVTLSSPQDDPTNAEEVSVIFLFSEPVYNFSRAALSSTAPVLRVTSWGDGPAVNASGDGTGEDTLEAASAWVAVVAAAEGTVSVGLRGGWVTNLEGIVLEAPPPPLTRTVDRSRPSVQLSANGDEEDPAVAIFSIDFNEPVWPAVIFDQLFAAPGADPPPPDSTLLQVWRRLGSEVVSPGITLDQGQLLGISITGNTRAPVRGSLAVSLTRWELTVTGASKEELRVFLGEGAVRDRANNTNLLSLPARFQIPDLEFPRVRITSPVNPTRAGLVPVTFKFTKAIVLPFPVGAVRGSLGAVRADGLPTARVPVKVTNIRQTDLLVFVGDVAVNSTVYGMGLEWVAAGGQWELSVFLPKAVAAATTGQPNIESNTLELVVDLKAPLAVVSSDALYTIPPRPGRPVIHIVPFSFVFSEPVKPTIPPGGLLRYISVRGLGGPAVSSSKDDDPELGAPPIMNSNSFTVASDTEWLINVSAVSGDVLTVSLASGSAQDMAGWPNAETTALVRRAFDPGQLQIIISSPQLYGGGERPQFSTLAEFGAAKPLNERAVQLSFTFSADPDLNSMLNFDVNRHLSVELFPTAFSGETGSWTEGALSLGRVMRKCTNGNSQTQLCTSDDECMASSAGKCLIVDAQNSNAVYFGNDTSPNPLQWRLPLYSYDFDAVNTSFWLASVVIPDSVEEAVPRATIAADSIRDEAGNFNVQSLPFSLKVDYRSPKVLVVSSAPEPFNRASIPVTFRFSEAVRLAVDSEPADASELFDAVAVSATSSSSSSSSAAAVELLNVTLTDLKLRKMEWTLTATVESSADFTLSIALRPDVVRDEASNAFVGGGLTLNPATGVVVPGPLLRSVDMRPLFVTITTPVNPTTSKDAVLLISFSKPVRGFASSAVSFDFSSDPVRPLGRRRLLQDVPQDENFTAVATAVPSRAPATNSPTPEPTEFLAPNFDLSDISISACREIPGAEGREHECTLSGLVPGSRLKVWVEADAARDAAGNGNHRSEDLLLVNGVLGLTVAVAGPGAVSSLRQVPFHFTWSQPIQRTSFTSAHIHAVDVATGEALRPATQLMMEVNTAVDGRAFVIYYASEGVTTMEVQVMEGHVLDDFGFGNRASNVVLVNVTTEEMLMSVRERACAATCSNGLCDVNGTCSCSAGFEDEVDWWRNQDCSVPTSVRRALFLASTIVCGMFLVFALYSLVILPRDKGFLRGHQRLVLGLVVLWAVSRGGFFLYRLMVATWDFLDALLLSFPLGVAFICVVVSLEVHLSFKTSTSRHVSGPRARILLLFTSFLSIVALLVCVISDDLLQFLGIPAARPVLLTVGLSAYTFLFVFVLVVYLLIVKAAPRASPAKQRRSFSTVPEPVVAMDSVTRTYLSLRQRRREGYGAVEANVEHVSRSGLSERLFFAAALLLLSHVGLLLSSLTWAFFLAWRWSEFFMMVVVLWAHRKQLKAIPTGSLRGDVKPFVLPDDDDDEESRVAVRKRLVDKNQERITEIAENTRIAYHQARVEKKKRKAAKQQKKKSRKMKDGAIMTLVSSEGDSDGAEEGASAQEQEFVLNMPEDGSESEGSTAPSYSESQEDSAGTGSEGDSYTDREESV